MTQPASKIRVDTALSVPIAAPIPTDAAESGPSPGASRLEVPGPERTPRRAYLEPAASPAGSAAHVVARVIRGDGEPLALVVIAGEVARVAAPPLAIAPRTDGAWLLYRDRLVQVDADGREQKSIAMSALGDVAGVAVVGAADDAAWVVGLDTAWHIDREGKQRGPYAWRGGLASASAGEALCALDKRSRAVRCVGPDGTDSTRELAVRPQPFEQLLWLDGDRAVTAQNSTVRFYDRGGVVAALNIQSAGLTAAGKAFVSAYEPGAVAVHVEPDEVRSLALPADVAAPMGAVSVDGDGATLYGRDRALVYRGEDVASSHQVDEAYYRDALFPRMWRLAARPVVAGAGGQVIVSASGPGRMVLVTARRP